MLNDFSVNQDLPKLQTRTTEQNVQEFRAAGARHSRYAEYFASSEDEGDVFGTVASHVSRLEDDFADWHSFSLIEGGGITSHHVLDKRGFG